MQLIKGSREALLKPLQIVSGIVERRQTLPILANILVRKDAESVSFIATDLEVQIETAAPIGVGRDVAATTISARKLVDILRALPEADVLLSLTNKKLTVQSGRSRFNLQTLSAEEFPTVAQGEYTADFMLAAATLKHLLHMVHFAMAAQDIRYYLNGMLRVADGSVVLAAGSIKITSTNADQEDAQEELEIEYAGDGLDIGFNVSYLLDVLANLKSESVAFSLGDALGSALITMPDSERFKYVVMPMRI